MKRTGTCTPILTAALVTLTATSHAQGRRSAYEQPPIQYSNSKPADAVARLLEKIGTREVSFKGTDNEILRAVLRELNVPVESQILVFSKTSMQGGLIDPANPRALYFSDSIYVGWVPGGLVEVASIDPQLGPIYYSFDPQDARDQKRTFVRETSCLRCHGGDTGREIPSLIARSVATDESGEISPGQPFQLTDDTTPFAQRWGGWYVTGYSGETSHSGNVFSRGPDISPDQKRPTDLTEFFDTSKYLTTTSDVGALLVFQHQVTMHNVLTRAAHRARRALMAAEANPEALPPLLSGIAEDVVDHLLFRNAAALPNGIEISQPFRQAFSSNTPRTSDGNSLKDFSSGNRLFANRCSFLIHSESFAALPAPLKSLIFVRLHEALKEGATDDRYDYLEADERKHILAILKETLPEAREAFRQTAR